MDEYLTQLFKALSTISTKGEDTVMMANILVSLENKIEEEKEKEKKE